MSNLLATFLKQFKVFRVCCKDILPFLTTLLNDKFLELPQVYRFLSEFQKRVSELSQIWSFKITSWGATCMILIRFGYHNTNETCLKKNPTVGRGKLKNNYAGMHVAWVGVYNVQSS